MRAVSLLSRSAAATAARGSPTAATAKTAKTGKAKGHAPSGKAQADGLYSQKGTSPAEGDELADNRANVYNDRVADMEFIIAILRFRTCPSLD